MPSMGMRLFFVDSQARVLSYSIVVVFHPVFFLVLLWRQIAKSSERTLGVEEMDVFIHGALQLLY